MEEENDLFSPRSIEGLEFSTSRPSPEAAISILSQPSKCLKFMTFREGCFVIRN